MVTLSLNFLGCLIGPLNYRLLQLYTQTFRFGLIISLIMVREKNVKTRWLAYFIYVKFRSLNKFSILVKT